MPKSLHHIAAVGAALAVAVIATVTATAIAQTPDMPPRPSAAAYALGDQAPPVIDGDISDAVWQKAQRIDRFYQFEPLPYAEPTERTEAWILYDRERLYVAVHAHDSEPHRITQTTMERDIAPQNDDVVRLLIDPRRSRREGYYIAVMAAGARYDALLTGNPQQNAISKWNTIWSARTRRVADGWTVEFAIPFRSLSYDPASTTWALDITRSVRRKGETMRWAPPARGSNQIEVAYAGELTGLSGMTQGRGLDIQGYGIARVTQDWQRGRAVSTGGPSATAYYRFTPSLTGLLTLNTDFSDRPLDTRQVNTTRFSLFEEETREFFLEDSDAFNFANFGTGDNANGRPFFSRNIGLVNGSVIDLDVGAKVSGSVGGVRLGALSVRTGASTSDEAQTLSVARASATVMGESRVGGIVTLGDPDGSSDNRVAGLDFGYRDSRFRPGKRLEGTLYALRSFNDQVGDDSAYGAQLRYPNEPWSWEAGFRHIGEQFSPQLGFVNRPGIRRYDAEIAKTLRSAQSRARRVQFTVRESAVTGLDDRLQSRFDHVDLEIESRHNDKLRTGIDNTVEVLDAPFLLPGGVPVPAGRYEFVRGYTELETASNRKLWGKWRVTCCDYFAGRSLESSIELNYFPSPRFNVSFKHRLQPIRLPTGRTSIHIESLTTTLNFNPDMKLIGEWQYDNVSRRFSGSVRYRWEPRPTSELLVTLGETATLSGQIPHAAYQSLGTVVAVRFGHRWQY